MLWSSCKLVPGLANRIMFALVFVGTIGMTNQDRIVKPVKRCSSVDGEKLACVVHVRPITQPRACTLRASAGLGFVALTSQSHKP